MIISPVHGQAVFRKALVLLALVLLYSHARCAWYFTVLIWSIIMTQLYELLLITIKFHIHSLTSHHQKVLVTQEEVAQL